MRYALETVSPPSGEPVTTAEAKTHLRVTNSDEDSYIDSLVVVARQQVEQYLQRALLTQTLQMTLDTFPPNYVFYPVFEQTRFDPVIYLARAPVQSVDEIRFIDTDGTQKTLDAADYRVDLASVSPRITPAYAETWPTTRPVTNAVEVEFTAGYGDASAVPEPIKHAIKILVATWFDEGRSAVTIGANPIAVPMTAEFILGPFRVAAHADP